MPHRRNSQIILAQSIFNVHFQGNSTLRTEIHTNKSSIPVKLNSKRENKQKPQLVTFLALNWKSCTTHFVNYIKIRLIQLTY